MSEKPHWFIGPCIPSLRNISHWYAFARDGWALGWCHYWCTLDYMYMGVWLCFTVNLSCVFDLALNIFTLTFIGYYFWPMSCNIKWNDYRYRIYHLVVLSMCVYRECLIISNDIHCAPHRVKRFTWFMYILFINYDDVIKWKHFPRYWSFVRGIHRSPAQRPVPRSFDVFFDLRLNKRLSKQSWGWWFETLSRPLWRQCNVIYS